MSVQRAYRVVDKDGRFWGQFAVETDAFLREQRG